MASSSRVLGFMSCLWDGATLDICFFFYYTEEMCAKENDAFSAYSNVRSNTDMRIYSYVRIFFCLKVTENLYFNEKNDILNIVYYS